MDILNTWVPRHYEGHSTDAIFAVNSSSGREPAACYKRAVKRLLRPAAWHKLANWPHIHYQAFDAKGQLLHRMITSGDYLRATTIHPGPARETNWVSVALLNDSSPADSHWQDWLGLQLCPCLPSAIEGQQPGPPIYINVTATIIVRYTVKETIASYHSRNERSDASAPEGLEYKPAAGISLNTKQWTAFCEALLQDDRKGRRNDYAVRLR
jgi:hypothetical protein